MSVPGGGLRVDLKSKEQKQGISFDFGWIFVIIIVILSGIICYFYGQSMKGKIVHEQKALQSWNSKIRGYNGIKGKLASLSSQISVIKTKIDRLRELRYDPLRYSLLLVKLADDIPKNVWINNLSIEPSSSQITLAGSSLDESGRPPLASIADLIMNLQNDTQNYFSNVQLQGTSASGKNGNIWTFNLRANYNVPLFQQPLNASQSKQVKSPAAAKSKMTEKMQGHPQKTPKLQKRSKGGKP
jgi:Tfp pilus assembly protein PilN